MSQPALGPLVSADLTGRVVIVTGANTGLGLAASKHLATMNPAKLIMTVRSAEKGEKALQELKTETGFDRAEVGILDLASFNSVKQFVENFTRENERLDMLLENAAIATEHYEVTEDDWEVSLQVNVLSPGLLAFLLLPLMLKTAKAYPQTVPRITVVSSGFHIYTKLDADIIGTDTPLALMNEKEYSTRVFATGADVSHVTSTVEFKFMLERRYGDVKMFNIFFARELQRLLSNRITVNFIDPGLCVSDLRRNITGERAVTMQAAVDAIAYTSEEGGRSLVYGLVAEQGNEEGVRGKYLSLMKSAETSPFTNSKEGLHVQTKLWDEIITILSNVDGSVRGIVDSIKQSA